MSKPSWALRASKALQNSNINTASNNHHWYPLGKRVDFLHSKLEARTHGFPACPRQIQILNWIEEPAGTRRDRREGATNGDLRWHCNVFVFVSCSDYSKQEAAAQKTVEGRAGVNAGREEIAYSHAGGLMIDEIPWFRTLYLLGIAQEPGPRRRNDSFVLSINSRIPVDRDDHIVQFQSGINTAVERFLSHLPIDWQRKPRGCQTAAHRETGPPKPRLNIELRKRLF